MLQACFLIFLSVKYLLVVVCYCRKKNLCFLEIKMLFSSLFRSETELVQIRDEYFISLFMLRYYSLPGHPDLTPSQSHKLRQVTLTVSNKTQPSELMFGTKLEKNKEGQYMDPCQGDSGGPLMYRATYSGTFILIGNLLYSKTDS